MLWDPFSYQSDLYRRGRFTRQRPFSGFMDWNYPEPEEQHCRCGSCFAPNFLNEDQVPRYSQRSGSFPSGQGRQRQERHRERRNYTPNSHQQEQPLQQQRRGNFIPNHEGKRNFQGEGGDQERVSGEIAPQLNERNPSRLSRSSNVNTRRSPTVSSSENKTVDMKNHREKPQIPLRSKVMQNRQLTTDKIEEAPVEVVDEMKIGQNTKSPAATRKENISMENVREKSLGVDKEAKANDAMPGKGNLKGYAMPTMRDAANAIKAAKNYVASNDSPEIQQKLSVESLAAEKLRKIDAVSMEVEELSRGVRDFDRNEKDFSYRYLEEMLTKCLLRLDDIQADGIEGVRNCRKLLVDRINSELVCLEEKLTDGHGLLVEANQIDAVEGNTSDEKDLVLFARDGSDTCNDNNDQFLNDKQFDSYQQSSIVRDTNCENINGNSAFLE